MIASARPSPIAWLVAPAALLFVLFFVLPFGVMAMMSFYSGNPVTNPNAFATTRHYERFIFDSAGKRAAHTVPARIYSLRASR